MWTTHIHCSSVPHPLSPCVGPGQVPTPEGVSPPASTGGAAQTKSQAGVTGNASCLVGEGGEGNLTARSHYVGSNVSIVCPFAQCSTVITICNNTLMSTKPSSSVCHSIVGTVDIFHYYLLRLTSVACLQRRSVWLLVLD